jgi:exosome complex exonuclease DIS3/RRP44
MRIDDKNLNDELTLGLRRLNKIAKIFKADRIKNGALTLASSEIRLDLTLFFYLKLNIKIQFSRFD